MLICEILSPGQARMTRRMFLHPNFEARFGSGTAQFFSQASSRSKGPLSDQIADATIPRGQCRNWVELPRSGARAGMTADGASRPLRRISAIVSFLNP